MISYNFGAEKYERIKEILKIGVATVTGLGILFYLAINFFSHDIIAMFVKNDENLFIITKEAVRLYSFTYVLMGINIIISAYFTAIEDALTSALLSILRGVIFINILLYILPLVLDSKGIWLSAPANEVITLVFSVMIFLTFGIKKIKSKVVEIKIKKSA